MAPNDCHKLLNTNFSAVNARDEYAHYSRQLILPEVGSEGQSALQNSSVSVFLTAIHELELLIMFGESYS